MTLLVGLVGCGRWGANVLRDLMALGVDVSVAEPDASRRARARAAGAVSDVTSAEQLSHCDGYVVVTPAHTHREVCEQLFPHRVPVFVEKPPATALADVEAMVTAAPEQLFVMHKWRYHPGVRALADAATSGQLGTVQRLETIRTGPAPLPADVDVLWHLGTHDLAISVEILGPAARAREARATRDVTGRIRACQATLTHPSGCEHRMTLASSVPDRVRRVVITGTEATAVLEDAEATSISVRGADRVEKIALAPTSPLTEELRAFVAHLDGGPPPVSDAATALAIARQLSALERLAEATRA